jgi:hypothetical protein
MPSSGMWRSVSLLQTDVSEERVASIFYPEDGGETLVYNKPTRRQFPEHGILHSHCLENVKSYKLQLLVFILPCDTC